MCDNIEVNPVRASQYNTAYPSTADNECWESNATDCFLFTANKHICVIGSVRKKAPQGLGFHEMLKKVTAVSN